MENRNELVPGSARTKACLSQCRLATYLSVGDENIGSCPCSSPYQCRFELHEVTPIEKFDDVNRLWNWLLEERFYA